MNVTLKETLAARGMALNPWTGFYFLQSLLMNLALGYSFSLLYTVAFTCVLHVLWRAAPRTQKVLLGIYSLVAAFYYPFGQAYGAPNFNTLLALHSTNAEESTEILTIFPWYSYFIALFIFALGVIAVRRKREAKRAWSKIDLLCLLFCVGVAFVRPVQEIAWDGVFRITKLGYPDVRFVHDVAISNQQVLDEKARLAQFAHLKDTWTVLAVKPKYHTYVVVIGESARRDALGAFGDAIFAGEVNSSGTLNIAMINASYQNAYGNLYTQPTDMFEAPYASTIGSLLPSTTPITAIYANNQLTQAVVFSSGFHRLGRCSRVLNGRSCSGVNRIGRRGCGLHRWRLRRGSGIGECDRSQHQAEQHRCKRAPCTWQTRRGD